MIKELFVGGLGAICMLYGILVYRLNSGSRTYLIWFGLGIVLMMLAIGLHLQLWAKLKPSIRRLITVVTLVVAASVVIVEGCIISGFFSKEEEELDYIIVLGAQVYEHGPSTILRYRLDQAYAYLMKHEDTVCIVSGGQGRNEPCAEAEVMYEYLLKKGVAKKRIRIENRSKDTEENIANSRAFLDDENDSVGIVTNNFHIFRSVHLAKKQGITKVHGIPAGATRLYIPNNMIREYFGVMKDFLRGNLG